MIPVRLGDETRSIGKPVDWDEAELGICDALSVHDSQLGSANIMTSAWKPDAEELRILNSGGHVFLGVFGTRHPVVHLYAA